MPGGGGMGRPLGPSGGREPGGGGTGLPEGLSGGRDVRPGASGTAGAAGGAGAAVSGAFAAGAEAAGEDGWAGALGAVGWAEAGRLEIRRDDRAGAGASAGAGGAEAAAGAATLRAGAFLAGAVPAVVLEAATFLAGAEAGAADVFLAGAGSSGWTGRRMPSASAFRRTRSAWASSMDEEWLLTPMPRERASSSPSLLVSPSSLASS
jgi:hypothetical protein